MIRRHARSTIELMPVAKPTSTPNPHPDGHAYGNAGTHTNAGDRLCRLHASRGEDVRTHWSRVGGALHDLRYLRRRSVSPSSVHGRRGGSPAAR